MTEKTSPSLFSKLAPILTFIVIVIAFQNWWRVDLLLNPIDNSHIQQQDVLLYSTSWCPYCRKARTFLERANIPYQELDVEKSAIAYQQYEKISGRGVPVLHIGDKIIQGYNPEAMRAAIETLKK